MIFYLALIDSESDKEKFEQIYWKYRDCIYYFAYEILKNEQDAEDVTQECLLQIAENIGKFEAAEGKKTLSLVILMTRHKAIDLYRKRKKQTVLSIEEYEENIPDPNQEPEWKDNTVKAILDALNSRYREILILRFCHGYSYPDIAKIMGIREETARKLLQRARKRFENLYYEQNAEE